MCADAVTWDQGLIPAHAGKTCLAGLVGAHSEAHPRSRGENLVQALRFQRSTWLIPAHAGKTSGHYPAGAVCRAHPRSRGENRAGLGTQGPAWGSSPLTRGKPPAKRSQRNQERLIPAHAGKTGKGLSAPLSAPAHPRSRGENIQRTAEALKSVGSSPLTRGKLEGVCLFVVEGGLIPAHAGKTAGRSIPSTRRGAHPRSRGENPWLTPASRRSRGSSPLTRGKPEHVPGYGLGGGLIPAHAGKTAQVSHTITPTRAHPRSRGEN